MSGFEGHRSGFVTVVGRPNVGKSTLLNRIVAQKVSIVSDKPQTTRHQVRAVLSVPGAQAVFVDTPGVHRPRTKLGERLNQKALGALDDVDLVCLVVEADQSIGPGDRYIAAHVARVQTPRLLVLNKVDRAAPEQIAANLAEAQDLAEFDAYVPLSAKTGDGVGILVDEILSRLPEGPPYYEEGVVSDQPEALRIAEIVREKLLEITREEVPHSIAVVVEDLEERDDGLLAVRAVILVERPSQKAIVIGKGGDMLKRVGTRARQELEVMLGTRVFLETRVRVERDWQRRDHALDRLGF